MISKKIPKTILQSHKRTLIIHPETNTPVISPKLVSVNHMWIIVFFILISEGTTHQYVGDKHIITAEPTSQVTKHEDRFRVLRDPSSHDHQQ